MNAEPGHVAFDAIVLAGGAGRRLGGVDKAAVALAGETLLDRALAALAGAERVVVVGPRRPVQQADREIVWTVEDPAGGGPAAALMQGIGLVQQSVVMVLAVDVPFAASAVSRLVGSLGGHDAAMLVDADGRRQPLVCAYRTNGLRARVADGPWENRSLRALVEGLQVLEVAAVGDESLDCDTPTDLERARRAVQDADRKGST